METNPSTPKVIVVGVHGVGYATSGTVRSAIVAALGLPSDDVDIQEVYWSDVFDPYNRFDECLDSHAVSRFARSVLVAASKDFRYSCHSARRSNPVQFVTQCIDVVSYLVLVALSLLGSVVLLVLCYLAICFDSGYWQYTPASVRLVPVCWISGILILALVTTVTGLMVQIGIGGFSHPEMIRVAFRIAARRVILTILGPFFTLLFGIDSGEWLRFAGVFVTFFFLFGAIVSPIITLAMATYLRHAGASADELARVPGSLFPRFLYFAGLGVALVIASFVWHWAVRPIAKIVSDVLVYLGDFPIPTATLVAGDESTTSFKN